MVQRWDGTPSDARMRHLAGTRRPAPVVAGVPLDLVRGSLRATRRCRSPTHSPPQKSNACVVSALKRTATATGTSSAPTVVEVRSVDRTRKGAGREPLGERRQVDVTPLVADLTADQETLVGVVWRAYVKHGQWPVFQFVDAELQLSGIDALATLRSFPVVGRAAAGPRYSAVHFKLAGGSAPRAGSVDCSTNCGSW